MKLRPIREFLQNADPYLSIAVIGEVIVCKFLQKKNCPSIFLNFFDYGLCPVNF